MEHPSSDIPRRVGGQVQVWQSGHCSPTAARHPRPPNQGQLLIRQGNKNKSREFLWAASGGVCLGNVRRLHCVSPKPHGRRLWTESGLTWCVHKPEPMADGLSFPNCVPSSPDPAPTALCTVPYGDKSVHMPRLCPRRPGHSGVGQDLCLTTYGPSWSHRSPLQCGALIPLALQTASIEQPPTRGPSCGQACGCPHADAGPAPAAHCRTPNREIGSAAAAEAPGPPARRGEA